MNRTLSAALAVLASAAAGIRHAGASNLLRLALLVVLAGASLEPALGHAKPGWSWQAPTPTPYTFRSAALVGEGRHGFGVGNGGSVVETRDGGFSWTERDIGIPRAANLVRIRFADDANGYLVGSYDPSQLHAADGIVGRTVDGGATWVSVDIPDIALFDIVSTGVDGAIAVGINTATGAASILRTENGTDWTIDEPSMFGLLYSVASPAPGVLIAVGIDGMTGSALIVRSVDGGAT